MTRARNEQDLLDSVLESMDQKSSTETSSTRRLSRTARRQNLEPAEISSDRQFDSGKPSGKEADEVQRSVIELAAVEQTAAEHSTVEQTTVEQTAMKQTAVLEQTRVKQTTVEPTTVEPAPKEDTIPHEPIFSLNLERLSVDDRFGREELYEEDEEENDSFKIGGAFENDVPFELETFFQKTEQDSDKAIDTPHGRRWYVDLDPEEKKTLEVTSFGQDDVPSLWQGIIEMFRESSLRKKFEKSRAFRLSTLGVGLLVFVGALNVGLSGCAQPVKLTNQTFVMELGTDVYANPSLYIDNADQVDLGNLSIEPRSPGITITDNRFITVSLDYLGVGSYDFVLKDGDAETPFVIKVKDTKAPTLKNSVDTIEISWGQKVNWDDVFGATDLSGVYYEPSLDFETTTGEHTVDVKIRDRFGNAITKTIKVTVNG